jgi:uncharacterized protein YbcI
MFVTSSLNVQRLLRVLSPLKGATAPWVLQVSLHLLGSLTPSREARNGLHMEIDSGGSAVVQRRPAANGKATPAQVISAGMVAIYKEHLGRGPMKVRTTILENTVMTVLQDSLTKAEQTLASVDGARTVRDLRRRMQDAMAADMTKLVETELHRQVVCLLSDHCPDPDYAVEVLILSPEKQGERPARMPKVS